VTCIEVLEHIPEERRPAALVEMGRVLRPGGLLILRVPHAGAFAWLDSNNVRFRLPRLYAALVGTGQRDGGYAHGSRDVVWHHHFTRSEVEALAGPGWSVTGERRGALFLLPLVDWACWPLYRLRRIDNPVFRGLQRIAAFDIGHDYGQASFDMLLALRRTAGVVEARQGVPAPFGEG
jgi:SAM-dependent methyltransferase